MCALQPPRKSKIFFICTVLNPILVDLIINIKSMLNIVLGTSKMSQMESSPSQVPPIIFAYYVLCM